MHNNKGLVRRLDELGRVVIPKEIRHSLKIENGNMLEFFYSIQDGLVVKKFEPIREFSGFGAKLLYALRSHSEIGFLLCDTEKVVAVQNLSKKDTIGKKLNPDLVEKLKLFHNSFDFEHPIESQIKQNNKVFPVVVQGNVVGCVVVSSEKPQGSEVFASVSTIVQILVDYLSE